MIYLEITCMEHCISLFENELPLVLIRIKCESDAELD